MSDEARPEKDKQKSQALKTMGAPDRPAPFAPPPEPAPKAPPPAPKPAPPGRPRK